MFAVSSASGYYKYDILVLSILKFLSKKVIMLKIDMSSASRVFALKYQYIGISIEIVTKICASLLFSHIKEALMIG